MALEDLARLANLNIVSRPEETVSDNTVTRRELHNLLAYATHVNATADTLVIASRYYFPDDEHIRRLTDDISTKLRGEVLSAMTNGQFSSLSIDLGLDRTSEKYRAFVKKSFTEPEAPTAIADKSVKSGYGTGYTIEYTASKIPGLYLQVDRPENGHGLVGYRLVNQRYVRLS